jgi:hypothetical protein
MLEPLGDRISACLEQAERCRQAAASEPDERVRQQLLYLEQQWQEVAESFQLIERLQLDHALPPEVEKLPRTSLRNRRPAQQEGLPAAVRGALQASWQSKESEASPCERPTARYSPPATQPSRAEPGAPLGLRATSLTHAARLKLFRNGSFHYQKNTKKQMQFFELGDFDALDWAERLHAQLHAFSMTTSVFR